MRTGNGGIFIDVNFHAEFFGKLFKKTHKIGSF